MSILIRPAATRFTTIAEGRTTHHSFSYGAHYDPDNIGFGDLIALNDEQLPPGTGYDEHRHAGVVIVTWVVEGRLQHSDSLGNAEVLEAGQVGIAETGSGIQHAEHADPEKGVRFLQFMLRQPDAATSYTVQGEGSVPIPVDGASLWLGQAPAGELTLPDSPLVDVFLVGGHAVVGDRELGPGDEARLTGERHRRIVLEEASTLALWGLPQPWTPEG